ncbi:blast:Membrane-bound alkaline phosphatase, partial [Drosophila guanche]
WHGILLRAAHGVPVAQTGGIGHQVGNGALLVDAGEQMRPGTQSIDGHIIATVRIIENGHTRGELIAKHMRVIGSDHQQCVLLVGQLLGSGNRFGELNRLVERHACLVLVMCLIDATSFDEQEVALLVLAHVLDGLARHLLQRGLWAVLRRLHAVLNVIVVEESQQTLCTRHIHGHQLFLGVHKDIPGIGRLELLDQVEAIGAFAFLRQRRVDKVLASAAKDHLQLAAHLAACQLVGNVLDARVGAAVGEHLRIVLPVPLGNVSVDTGGRGMRHTGGGHQTRPLARIHGPLGDRVDVRVLVQHGRAVGAGHHAIDANGALLALDAAQVRGGRARRVGHNLVHGVGLREARIGEVLKGQSLLLATDEVAGCRGCGYAHAIANEENHVLGLPLVRLSGELLLDELHALLTPKGGGLLAFHLARGPYRLWRIRNFLFTANRERVHTRTHTHTHTHTQ